jgi:uncharacterized protein YrrD
VVKTGGTSSALAAYKHHSHHLTLSLNNVRSIIKKIAVSKTEEKCRNDSTSTNNQNKRHMPLRSHFDSSQIDPMMTLYQ